MMLISFIPKVGRNWSKRKSCRDEVEVENIEKKNESLSEWIGCT